jgi:uncharacterized membrane protein YgcG
VLKPGLIALFLSLAALRGQASALPAGLPEHIQAPVTDLAGILSVPALKHLTAKLNGALLLLAKDTDGSIWFCIPTQGYMTAAICKRIIFDEMDPLMHQGRTDAAVDRGTSSILAELATAPIASRPILSLAQRWNPLFNEKAMFVAMALILLIPLLWLLVSVFRLSGATRAYWAGKQRWSRWLDVSWPYGRSGVYRMRIDPAPKSEPEASRPKADKGSND